VVELPRVVLEGDAGLVAGDGLPALVVDGAVAHRLEVLHGLVAGLVGLVQRVEHRRAGDRHLLVTPVHLGGGDAERLGDGGRDVAHDVERVAQAAGIGDVVGPVDDEALHAALVGVLPSSLEGMLRPGYPTGGTSCRPADVVDAVDRLSGSQ
jgi:hypothetical protein